MLFYLQKNQGEAEVHQVSLRGQQKDKKEDQQMEKMNRKQMIDFLRDMKKRKEALSDEKIRIRSSAETMEEAIRRNTFIHSDNDGSSTHGYDTDKVLHILLNSERDIEEEKRSMVLQMHVIYEIQDKINYIQQCILLLPGADRKIITEVLIDDENVGKMADKYGFCLSHFYEKLNQSVDRLVDLYNQGCEHAGCGSADRFILEVRTDMVTQEDPL